MVCVWGREWDVRSAVPLSGVGSGVEWSGERGVRSGVEWSGECGVEWLVGDVWSAVPLSGVGSGVDWSGERGVWSGAEWGVRGGVACGGRVECSAAEWSGEWS